LDLQVPPGENHRLFVAEKTGRIRIIKDEVLIDEPFLDLSSVVTTEHLEQGLVGFAFHPRYSDNGRFFVHYIDRDQLGHIAEFRVSANPDLADAGSQRALIVETRQHIRHNGGALRFGPDGFLYASEGDGGNPRDVNSGSEAQNLDSIFGKILRLDVDHGDPYAIPPGNPFVGVPGALGEIWAYGLRNPWRFAINHSSGDLLIGDVGEGRFEEIDFSRAGKGGEDFGWPAFEGPACYLGPCVASKYAFPIFYYGHERANGQDTACAVIAGPVYAGCRMPGYEGVFFYGDYCGGHVWSFRVQDGKVVDRWDLTPSLGNGLRSISSFGEDASGEIYILDLHGEVYRIDPSS
jgi:glucose/arabinose dehydrogenase